jgi:type I restriction enzyme S subunit
VKKGWEICSIGEVCDLLTGGTPSKTKPEFFGGSIKWLVSGDIHQGEIFDCEGRITKAGLQNSNARYLPVDSVLIALAGQGKTRATVALLRTKATCNQSLICITPKDRQRLLPEFIYVNLHGRYEEIRRMTGDSGDDRRGLNMRLVSRIQIPIPLLPEQRRIVAILDEAFEGITAAKANAEKNLRNAKELFDSQSLAEFDRLGREHEWVTLEQLLEQGWIQGHLDGNHGSDYPRKEEFVSSGVPYISANCLAGNDVVMSRCKHLSPSRASKLRKGIAHNRDVLFAHNATVGPVAILETSEPQVILGTSLTYYRCDESRILPEYLSLFMRSAGFVRQYEQVMRQSTRNQVPITKQREFRHVIPPIQVQTQIINRLGSLSRLANDSVALNKRKIAALDDLKASIIHQAFAGDL